MKEKIDKIRNTQKGITLVALVITIIVLLLLSVVSINIVQNSELIEKTKLAKEEHRASAIQEQIDLLKNEQEIAKQNNETEPSINELIDKLQEQKLITEEEKNTIMQTGNVTIGSKEIIFSKDAILPQGYTRCKYLESVNGSYLLIPNKLTEDSIITTKIQPMKSECSFVFGYTYDGYMTGAQLRPQNNSFEGRWGNSYWKKYVAYSIQETYNLSFKNGELIVNGVSYPFDKKIGYIVSSLDIGVFARNVSGEIDYAVGSLRMYSLKIDNYINLIPCLDSNNRPCMYDTVSGQTFYNQGTGEFIAGPALT